MAYWLLKTEPDDFSWDDQVKKGAKGEVWSGVRNFTARQASQGDEERRSRVFLSHRRRESSGRHRRDRRRAYPDPTAAKGEPWVVVDIKAVEPLPKPVTLAAIKAEKSLKDMALVKYARLVGAAGDGRGMEGGLQDGRREGLTQWPTGW